MKFMIILHSPKGFKDVAVYLIYERPLNSYKRQPNDLWFTCEGDCTPSYAGLGIKKAKNQKPNYQSQTKKPISFFTSFIQNKKPENETHKVHKGDTDRNTNKKGQA